MQGCTAKWSFLCHSVCGLTHNENFQKLITEKPSSSHCHYRQRGDRPADSLGSCREPGSDTLSHSPALIVQKMWFVPQLYFQGKVVFTVGGVPVTWIAPLSNRTGTFEYVCARVLAWQFPSVFVYISKQDIQNVTNCSNLHQCENQNFGTIVSHFSHNSVSQAFFSFSVITREGTSIYGCSSAHMILKKCPIFYPSCCLQADLTPETTKRKLQYPKYKIMSFHILYINYLK